MFLDVGFELPTCRILIAFGQRVVKHSAVIFQRKFCIDANRTHRRGQYQRTIGAQPAFERELKTVRIRRQDIAHQALQLHFAKRAARAFVAEDFLQADHIGRQTLDFFLRLVDHRKPCHHRREGIVGLLEAFVEPLGDFAGNLVQPAVDGL